MTLKYPCNLKILVKTPRNQAARCVRTQKDQLLGLKKSGQIKESKVTAHNEFYWIVPIKDLGEYDKLTKRLALGENMIKKFYSTLFKLINRVNRLAKKFKKTGTWIKKYLQKRIRKMTAKGDDQQGMLDYLDDMDDTEFKDFLVISDKEEMDKFLKGDLITIKKI